MADLNERFERDLNDGLLSNETQVKTMQPVIFKEPRSEEEIYAAASKNHKFVRMEDAVREEYDNEFKESLKREGTRAVLNAASYLWYFASGGRADPTTTATEMKETLGLQPRDPEDSTGAAIGATIEFGSALWGGAGAIKMLNKMHRVGQSANLLRGAPTVGQQLIAGVAGETTAVRAVAPDVQAAYVEISNAFGLEETFAKPVVELATYLFAQDADDTEAEKFIKQFAGDFVFVKNVEKIFEATIGLIRNFREYRDTQASLSDKAAEIRGMVTDGDINDEIAAQKLMDMTSVELPDGPQGEEMLEVIQNSFIEAGTASKKKLVQLAAGKKFTEGSHFVAENGNPVILTHRGDIEGVPSGYFQKPGKAGSPGFHLTIHTGDVTQFEKKGKLVPYFVNIPPEKLLDLRELGTASDVVINMDRAFIKVIADDDRFDLNIVNAIKQRADSFTDEDLIEIVKSHGLDPAGYNLDIVRSQWFYEHVLDSAGFEGVLYKNFIQGGDSAFVVNPENVVSSAYSQNTQRANSYRMKNAEAMLGETALNKQESLFAEELLKLTRQSEDQIGLDFVPSNRPVGIDFNFDRLLGNESMKSIIDDVSLNYSDVIDEAKRGIITNLQTKKLAKDLNLTVEQLLARRKGEVWNAEKTLAARQIMMASSGVLDNLAGRITKRSATDAEKAAYVQQLQLHALIQAQLKGSITEAARAVQSQRIFAGSNFEGIKSILESTDVEDMADKYLRLEGDQAAKNKFAEQISRRNWDTALYVMTNSLLSNPLTQAKNLVGNSLVQIYALPESLVEMTIGGTRRMITGSPEGKRLSTGIVGLRSIYEAFGEGFSQAGRSFATGVPSDRFTKSGHSLNNVISSKQYGLDSGSLWGRSVDLLGFMTGLPGRSLLTQDEFFKGFEYTLQKNMATHQRLMEGVQNGADDVTLSNDYFNGIHGYDDAINEKAIHQSHISTFTNDLDGILNSVQKMRYKHPFIQVVLPFFRAPANIVGMALSKTPAALLSTKVRSDILAGGVKMDKALARITLGSSIMGYTFMQGIDGKVTGSGTTNYAYNKQMASTGRQPYSFVFQNDELSDETLKGLKDAGVDVKSIDNQYFISYRGFEPIGTLVALAADTSDFMKFYNGDLEGRGEIAALGSLFAATQVGNNTFMRNFYDLTRAIKDPDSFLVPYLAGLSAQFVPGSAALGGAERVVDPSQRVADLQRDGTMLQDQIYKAMARIQSRIPGSSEDLPFGLNVWGDRVEQGTGSWSDMLNPAHVSIGKRQAVDFEMEKLGNFIEMPSADIEGVRISAEQYNDMVISMNTIKADDPASGLSGNLRQVLNQFVQTDIYQRLTRDNKIRHIDRIKNIFLDAARKVTRLKDPSLESEIIRLKRQEAAETIRASEGIQ